MNLHGTAFAEALESVAPPPCIGCKYNGRCGSEELACGQFFRYTETGRFSETAGRLPSGGMYRKCFPKEDTTSSAKGRRNNPVNESQQKKRTCTVCKTTYTGIYEHFGYKNGKVCKHCREAGYDPMAARRQSKVCVSCGEEKVGLKTHFRQTSIAGTNGRVKVYRDVCKACEGRYVSLAI